MSTQDYLKAQLRLVVAQFGRRPVLEALASTSEASPEVILDEIGRLESNRKPKAIKRPKSLEDHIAAIPGLADDRRALVQRLGRLYEAKQFLPNLRDADEFLRRNGAPPKKHKSRRDALGPVLNALAALPRPELETLVERITTSSGHSDFALLARQLMGKP